MTNAEYQREYRKRNHDVLRAKARARYLKNREVVKLANRRRYLQNAEKYREGKRLWRAAHPEEQKAISRRCYQNTKKKRQEANKLWNRANPEKAKQIADRKYRRNRERILARMRDYEQKNREKINARRARRYHSDPAFRIKKNLARRLTKKLTDANKRFAARTTRLVGCNVAFLRAHLESLFQPGMTWDNYGAWEVDHIIPCARFDLCDPVQQAACFHFKNLQPLWSSDNRSKGARLLAA